MRYLPTLVTLAALLGACDPDTPSEPIVIVDHGDGPAPACEPEIDCEESYKLCIWEGLAAACGDCMEVCPGAGALPAACAHKIEVCDPLDLDLCECSLGMCKEEAIACDACEDLCGGCPL